MFELIVKSVKALSLAMIIQVSSAILLNSEAFACQGHGVETELARTEASIVDVRGRVTDVRVLAVAVDRGWKIVLQREADGRTLGSIYASNGSPPPGAVLSFLPSAREIVDPYLRAPASADLDGQSLTGEVVFGTDSFEFIFQLRHGDWIGVGWD